MSKYYLIDGYWKDTKDPFTAYIVKEFDDAGEDDDEVFFYGLSEQELREAIAEGENTALEFVITDYSILDKQ